MGVGIAASGAVEGAGEDVAEMTYIYGDHTFRISRGGSNITLFFIFNKGGYLHYPFIEI